MREWPNLLFGPPWMSSMAGHFSPASRPWGLIIHPSIVAPSLARSSKVSGSMSVTSDSRSSLKPVSRRSPPPSLAQSSTGSDPLTLVKATTPPLTEYSSREKSPATTGLMLRSSKLMQ